MKRIKSRIIILGVICLPFILGCKKDWLDAKPIKELVIPQTISDYQALLDNTTERTPKVPPFNDAQSAFDEIGAGDYFVTDASLNTRSPKEKAVYLWHKDIYVDGNVTEMEWDVPYKRIFYTNIILEGIEKIVPVDANEEKSWKQVKGSALFFRAYSLYNLSQLFCKAYDKSTASIDLGLPIRLTSDFNEISIRASVLQTYNQIIGDLTQAKELLPISGPINSIYRFRPTKAAANAMLARVYLSMAEYDSALINASSSLSQYDILSDYNDYSAVGFNPLGTNTNSEILFSIALFNYGVYHLVASQCNVAPDLYNSYADDDLRKTLFWTNQFGGQFRFRGSYYGSIQKFSGLATDEVYLIRAECYARKGNITEALSDLNKLLEKRWKNTVTYVPVTAIDADDALNKILMERRKELCFRGIRWSDLRRLNRDNRFKVDLQRTYNGTVYTLPANDPKYVLPIPTNVIQLSGIEQNPR